MKHIDRRFTMYLDLLTSVKDVQDFLSDIEAPDDANFDVKITKGDRPWESDQARIEVNW